MNDLFKQVEKHLIRLKTLNERLNQGSDPYIRKFFANELKREADIAGKAVKKYIKQDGDPQKVAEFYKLTRNRKTAKD
jgi:hypothetical protein